jgi:hypothetical protein
MTRWLFPILALYLFAVSFSAMRFDRIDHANAHKEKWPVLGLEIDLSATSDFFVWSVPMVAGGVLLCGLVLAIYAGSHRKAERSYRLPPVGPVGSGEHEVSVDKAVRVAVAGATMGLGVYASVHLFRHLVMHSVYDHTTKAVCHGPGWKAYLLHWSTSGDLRFGHPEGITFYAGFQPAAYALLLGLGLGFVALWLWRLLRPVRA